MIKKNFLFSAISASMLLFSACTDAPDSDNATTTEAVAVDTAASGTGWKVDPATSKVEWIATKVSAYHTGTVPVKSGELQVKDGAVTGGSFVLDIANLAVVGPKPDTGMNNKLLGHLKSPDFFDVATYPEATFVITSVAPFTGAVKDSADPRQESISKYKVPNPSHTISGNLTIKGVTKNIEFPALVTINGDAVDAIAKFNIDRKQWGIVYPGKPDDLIRDEIHFGVELKAAK